MTELQAAQSDIRILIYLNWVTLYKTSNPSNFAFFVYTMRILMPTACICCENQLDNNNHHRVLDIYNLVPEPIFLIITQYCFCNDIYKTPSPMSDT